MNNIDVERNGAKFYVQESETKESSE